MNKYMYIDLITLLPPPGTTTGDETKDKKPATVESFDQWLEAWSTHEKTYLTNPARYLELAQYRCIIQKANWKFCWKAVYDFDVQFRMSLSGTTKRLDQIDSTLYTSILDSSAVRAEGTSCQHCKSDHHLVWDCSFRTKQTLESKVSSKVSTSAMSQLKFARSVHFSPLPSKILSDRRWALLPKSARNPLNGQSMIPLLRIYFPAPTTPLCCWHSFMALYYI